VARACFLIASLLVVLSPPLASAATTVWAVGDGADSGTHDDALAAMIQQSNPDAFLYLGDVYESGTANEFAQYYAPGYGRLKAITRPTPGNHEWDKRAEGYDPFWGSAFAAPHYYSFDLGGWHLIGLNSEEDHDQGSPQLAWLRSDLSERRGNCTIGFWHRARYSAGTGHGDESSLATVWGMLAGRSAIVLTGHDHSYQRFKPINGITNWVVGSGGHGHTGVDPNDPRLAVQNSTDYGALRLDLTTNHADFAFVSEAGRTLDSGSVACDRTRDPGSADTRRPRLTRVTVSRKRLRARSGSSRRLTFRYTLSERATVTITIKRLAKERAVPMRRLTDAGRRGLNSKRYSGTFAGRPLRPGVYVAVLEALDRAGNASKPKTARFRVLKARAGVLP
jgi:hypothetical protein